MSGHVCPECGAKLAEGAGRCDLCGSPIESGPTVGAPKPEAGDIPGPASDAEVFCNQCGWQNPPRARFCSRCGSPLQQVAVAAAEGRPAATKLRPPSTESEDSRSLAPHVAVPIGLAVLVVVALYLVTVISKQRVNPDTGSVMQAPVDVRSASVIDAHESVPIEPLYAAVVDSMEAAARDADGESAAEAQRRLSDFLLEIGRLDRAAIEQRRVAVRTGSMEDWKRASDLLFDWMESIEDEDKVDVALLAVDALKKLLELDATDLDARAKLGWAYQFDPSNPMEAIRQTNLVLEGDPSSQLKGDPDHLMANYNKAVFLTRINRLDEASRQFERVKTLAEEGSIYFLRAEAWLNSIKRSQAENAG